ncbi:hypothetical protein AcV5_001357 [Taiwanofungus camphoratus]|nr:hypothetical protein AcV5_001357 [Antrodia cinnamomea]
MPSLTASDAISHIICTLECIVNVSYAAPAFGAVVTAAISLLQTIEKVKDNKKRAIRLARRVADLTKHVQEIVDADPEAINDRLRANVKLLQSTLDDINRDLEKHLQRRPLSRFMCHSSIGAKLDEHLDTLRHAQQAFNTISLIAIQQELGHQRRTSFSEERIRTLALIQTLQEQMQAAFEKQMQAVAEQTQALQHANVHFLPIYPSTRAEWMLL